MTHSSCFPHSAQSILSQYDTKSAVFQNYHTKETADTHSADFRELSPQHLKFKKPANHSTLTFIMRQYYEVTDVYLTELLEVNNKNGNTDCRTR